VSAPAAPPWQPAHHPAAVRPARPPRWAVATRYDKRAVNYRAMVVIASLLIWLEG
jgi:hypothetical protein